MVSTQSPYSDDNFTTGSYFSTTPESTKEDFYEYEIYKWLYQHITPIIILMGTIGNILTITVMVVRKFGKPATRLLLVCLAVADTCCLYTGALRRWLKHTFSLEVRDLSNASCVGHVFLVYYFLQMSSWILSLVSLERLVSVMLPVRAKTLCTVQVTAAALVCVAVFLIFHNFIFFLAFGHNTKGKCKLLHVEYKYFWTEIYVWMELTTYTLLPFLIILSCNVVIVYRIYQGHKKRQRQQVTQRSEQTAQITSMTIMLLITSFVFLILTLPSSLYYIVTRYGDAVNPQAYARQILAGAVLNLLAYLNNASNFLLYCATGRRFRTEVMAVVSCRFGSRSSVHPIETEHTYNGNANTTATQR